MLFLNLNARFRCLLIQHQHVLHSFELSTWKLHCWENILPNIESEIRVLKLTDLEFSQPLSLFSNLTTLIISTPYNLFNDDFKKILKSTPFQMLKSFKIKSQLLITESINIVNLNDEQKLFQQVFSNNNILETFEYLSPISSISMNFFQTLSFNPNIQSLTLNFDRLINISHIIQFTPSLKYLNAKIQSPVKKNQYIWPKVKRVKLEKIFLTFYNRNNIDQPIEIDYQQIKSLLKQFSSSLICLSLNFADLKVNENDDFLFNGTRLKEELLISLMQLQDFRLFLNLSNNTININEILSSFQNDFYIDHQWFFDIHQHYLYSSSYQSKHISHFNDHKLKKRLWSNIKSITLNESNRIDEDLFKLFQLQMPNLESITMTTESNSKIMNRPIKMNGIHQINITLNSVTTIYLNGGSIENEIYWLSSLPNLKYLFLDSVRLSHSTNELTSVLYNRIEILNVKRYIDSSLLIRSIWTYFSNLQYLTITLEKTHLRTEHEDNSELVMKLLLSLKKLRMLSLTLGCGMVQGLVKYNIDEERKIFFHMLMNNSNKCSYKVQCIDDWIHFLKKI